MQIRSMNWLFLAVLILAAGCQPAADSGSENSSDPAAGNEAGAKPLDVSEVSFEGQPAFACLLAGRGSDQSHWLAMDQVAIYLDRDQDGTFKGPDERIPWPTDASGEGRQPLALGELGGVSYVLSLATPQEEDIPAALQQQIENWLSQGRTRLSVRPEGAEETEDVVLWLGPAADQAPRNHITGPLQPGLKWGEQTVLSRSQPVKFEVQIGVSQAVPGRSDVRAFPTLLHKEFPADAYPIAIFRFPNREPGSGPIEQEVHLKERC